MAISKVALFLVATLAISTAAPLDLGGVLGGVVGSVGGVVNGAVGTVNGVVGSVTGTLDDLLGDVEGIVQGLTSTVSQLLQQVVTLLKIPSGTNPLVFIQNLVSQLDDILAKLLGTVGSGVDNVVDDVTGNVDQILAQVAQLLNIPQTANLVGAIQQLLAQLEQILQQVLTVVSQLVKELLGQGGLLGDLVGTLNDVKLAVLLQKLVSTLTQIVDGVTKIKAGGL